MTIEIGRVYPHTWKTVKTHAFTLVSAGAIAIAAFVVMNGFADTGPRAISGALPSSELDPARLEELASRPTATYFLVGSEEQYDQVVAEQQLVAAERQASGGRKHLFQVRVADSEENELDAWQWLEDNQKPQWRRTGVARISVVDLRSR
jgi:hypothetical protein